MELQEITFARMLADNAKKNESKSAVFFKDYDVTYRDLNDTSDCFAARLLEMGLTAGDRVALRANNSTQWLTAFFGIIKAGGVAVLLDGNMKSLSMLDDLKRTESKFIIHSASLASNSAKKLTKLLGISEDNTALLERVNVTCAPEDLIARVHQISETDDCQRPAVIFFTSGASGIPKAVIHSQYSILNAALSQEEQYKSLQAHSLSLMIPMSQSFGLTLAIQYIAAGNALYLPDSMAAVDLIQLIKMNDIAAIAASELTYVDISTHPALNPSITQKLHACYVCGGFPYPSRMMRIEMTFSGPKLINGYHLTETCAFVTAPTLSDAIEYRSSNAGKAIPNVSIALYDPKRRKMSENEFGEILVKGFCVTKGYYNAPENEQPVDALGWLHTGDAGIIKDGKLYPLGRYEDVIRLDGKKIVPLSIEKFIARNNSIKDVKVFGSPCDDQNDSIQACIVLKPNYIMDEATLREELKQQIPDNMHPQNFFVFDDFPRTANGKLDIKALKNDMLDRVRTLEISQDLTNGILIANLSIKNETYMIMPTVSMLESLANDLGFSSTKIKRINHAAEEILTDRIMNAYGSSDGEITIEVYLMTRGLRLFFRDRGSVYNIEDSDATTLKIVMNMVDNFITMKDSADYPCLCLDFFYDKDFSIDAFILEHSKTTHEED